MRPSRGRRGVGDREAGAGEGARRYLLPPATPSTDQVTAVSLEPLTAAVNEALPPQARLADDGDSLTDPVPGATTFTVAEPDLFRWFPLQAATV